MSSWSAQADRSERGRTSGAERAGQNERGKATGGTYRARTTPRQPKGGKDLSTAFSSRYCVEIRFQVYDNNNERKIVAKVGQGARDLGLTFLTTNSSELHVSHCHEDTVPRIFST